jgi:hypothetical protein
VVVPDHAVLIAAATRSDARFLALPVRFLVFGRMTE